MLVKHCPVVELNPGNTAKTVFFYGEKSNVPSAMQRDGKTYRIVSNHLGSVRLVVDVSNGDIAQQLDYDAWGKVIADSNPGFQPFGFAGGLYDPLPPSPTSRPGIMMRKRSAGRPKIPSFLVARI